MKRLLFTILSVAISFSLSFSAWAIVIPPSVSKEADEIALDAQSAILIDASTGEILYEKDIYSKQYPASITKLMTMLLALENCENIDETITFSKNAVFSIEPGSSHIAIDADEQITMRQALYAVILRSANEVSNGIAEHIDGSMENFSAHMTERAFELGCKNTNFVNAHGLHDENHYTTAYDMALIARQLLEFPFFTELISETYYEIPPTNKQPEIRYLHGQNQLINPNSTFYYENCLGGKTGFTNEAQNTLVAYARSGNTTLISVVLKSTGYGEYTDTIKLFDYGFNNFETLKLANSGELVKELAINDSNTSSSETVNAIFKNNVFATVSKLSSGSVEKSIELPDSIELPVSKDQPLGSVIFKIEGEKIASADLVSDREITPLEPSAEKSGKKFISFKTAFILIIFAVISIAASKIIMSNIAYNRRRRRRKIERARRSRQIYSNINK